MRRAILALVLVSLVACGGDGPTSPDPISTPAAPAVVAATPTPAPSPTPSPEATPAPEATPRPPAPPAPAPAPTPTPAPMPTPTPTPAPGVTCSVTDISTICRVTFEATGPGPFTAEIYRVDSTGAVCQSKKFFGDGSAGSFTLSPCTCPLASTAKATAEVRIGGTAYTCKASS